MFRGIVSQSAAFNTHQYRIVPNILVVANTVGNLEIYDKHLITNSENFPYKKQKVLTVLISSQRKEHLSIPQQFRIDILNVSFLGSQFKIQVYTSLLKMFRIFHHPIVYRLYEFGRTH